MHKDNNYFAAIKIPCILSKKSKKAELKVRF